MASLMVLEPSIPPFSKGGLGGVLAGHCPFSQKQIPPATSPEGKPLSPPLLKGEADRNPLNLPWLKVKVACNIFAKIL